MYTFAAVLYLISACLFCAYLWWISRKWYGLIKNCLRIWVAILLFVPGYVAQGSEDLAPSFMIVLFTTFTDSWEAAKPLAAPMISALAISTSVIFAVSFVNWVRRPKATDTEETTAPTQDS